MAPTEQKVYFVLVEILDEIKAIHKLIAKDVAPPLPPPTVPLNPDTSVTTVDARSIGKAWGLSPEELRSAPKSKAKRKAISVWRDR